MVKKNEEQPAAAETDEQPVAEAADDALEVEVVNEILLQPRTRSSKFELRFSPFAWAKILWIRDYCNTEIAGFGISSMEDPFYMIDFRTIKQKASAGHFEFDDDALNEYLSAMFEEGKQPGECMRLWVHTHPTRNFAAPSGHDEITFRDAFGSADWAMMIIVDEGDNVYARLRFKSGASQLAMIVPNSIDCQPPFRSVDEADAAAWKEEADTNIDRTARSVAMFPTQGAKVLPARFDRHMERRMNPFADDFETGNEFMERLLSPGGKSDSWENIDTLLMGEERVVEITTDKAGNVLVLLNNAWLIYDADVTPKCREGAVIAEAHDIADVPPQRCGELTWLIDRKSGVQTPTYESEVVDGYVQYFDGDSDSREQAAVDAAIAAADDTDDDIEVEVIGEVKLGP